MKNTIHTYSKGHIEHNVEAFVSTIGKKDMKNTIHIIQKLFTKHNIWAVFSTINKKSCPTFELT